jgi:hypothetical protein
VKLSTAAQFVGQHIEAVQARIEEQERIMQMLKTPPRPGHGGDSEASNTVAHAGPSRSMLDAVHEVLPGYEPPPPARPAAVSHLPGKKRPPPPPQPSPSQLCALPDAPAPAPSLAPPTELERLQRSEVALQTEVHSLKAKTKELMRAQAEIQTRLLSSSSSSSSHRSGSHDDVAARSGPAGGAGKGDEHPSVVAELRKQLQSAQLQLHLIQADRDASEAKDRQLTAQAEQIDTLERQLAASRHDAQLRAAESEISMQYLLVRPTVSQRSKKKALNGAAHCTAPHCTALLLYAHLCACRERDL